MSALLFTFQQGILSIDDNCYLIKFQPVCEKKIRRTIDTQEIEHIQMMCKQRTACDARTKFYSDGQICKNQGNNREECITCAFGEVGADYNCGSERDKQ